MINKSSVEPAEVIIYPHRYEHQSDLSLYLYSAHLDVRPLNAKPCVRIFVMMSKPTIESGAYPFCHLWLDRREEPITVRATNFRFTGWEGLWKKEDDSIMNTPQMLDCELPSG